MIWRLIPSGEGPSQGQMAWDEESFQRFLPSQSPILRFFSFSQPTLTLGRLEARRRKERVWDFPQEVRPTGGRAVLHGEGDLCYSILAPVRDPLVGGDLILSYERISLILAEGLRSLGRQVDLTREKHRGMEDPHCFSAPSQAELTFGGKKVAGGAQARRGDVFLQQGVVLLRVSPDWGKAFPGAGPSPMAGLNEDPSLPALSRRELELGLTEAFRKSGVVFEKALTGPIPSLKLGRSGPGPG